MSREIPSDLVELLNSTVIGNVEDFNIDIKNNENGEGFIAEIIFINFTHKLTGNKIQLIVKQEQVRNGKTVEKFRKYFQTEFDFFDIIWPFINRYYRNVSKGNFDFVPKCLGGSNTGRIRIVLENLGQPGYIPYDKTKPFDDDHFQLIFKRYGVFHGVSMALRELDNEQYKILVGQKRNIFYGAFTTDFFIKGFIEGVQEAQTYFDHVQEKGILHKLKLYEETGLETIRQFLIEDYPNGVLLHGDCWSNNLMFKYNDQKKPEDVKLIDFQMVCHGSPVLDLSHCLYSAANEEILNKLDDYLKIYHNSLTHTLKEFGLVGERIYPIKILREEWRKYCKFGFPLGILLWKIKLLPRHDVPDLTKDWDKTKNAALSEDMNKVYEKRIRELIIHLYDNDFF